HAKSGKTEDRQPVSREGFRKVRSLLFEIGVCPRFFPTLLLALCGVAAAQQPSVILISVDTLRADRSSGFSAFAEHGTTFTAADAQAPLTLPSHASLFTSTYPFANRIQENAEPVPASAVTLAAVLRQHGYKTSAFIGSVFLEQRMGLA